MNGFGSVDIAALQAKYQQMVVEAETRGGGNFKWLNLKSGANKLRLLPPKDEKSPFYVECSYHYKIGPGRQTVACLKTVNQLCPICNLVAAYRKEGKDASVQLAKDMSAKRKYFFNVIDRIDNTAKILAVPPTVATTLLAYIVKEDWKSPSGMPLLIDPEQGLDIEITKTGSQMDTKYQIIPMREVSPFLPSEAERKAAVEGMADLKALLKFNTAEEIGKIMMGEQVTPSASVTPAATTPVAAAPVTAAAPPPAAKVEPAPPAAKEAVVQVDSAVAAAQAAVDEAIAKLKKK